MELKHQKTQNATSYQKRKNIYIYYYNAHGCVIQYCMKRMQPGLYVTHSVQGERKTLKIDSNCEKKMYTASSETNKCCGYMKRTTIAIIILSHDNP